MKLVTYIQMYNRSNSYCTCEEEINSIRNEILNEYFEGVNKKTLESIVQINMQDGLDKCYILNVISSMNKHRSAIQ